MDSYCFLKVFVFGVKGIQCPEELYVKLKIGERKSQRTGFASASGVFETAGDQDSGVVGGPEFFYCPCNPFASEPSPLELQFEVFRIKRTLVPDPFAVDGDFQCSVTLAVCANELMARQEHNDGVRQSQKPKWTWYASTEDDNSASLALAVDVVTAQHASDHVAPCERRLSNNRRRSSLSRSSSGRRLSREMNLSPRMASTSRPLQPRDLPTRLIQLFRNHFSDLDAAGETLIDVISCSYKNHRGLLLSGRMFLTDRHVLFYASNFGKKTYKSIGLRDITNVHKSTWGRLIPNAVSIETSSRKYFFGSLFDRSAVYTAICDLRDLARSVHESPRRLSCPPSPRTFSSSQSSSPRNAHKDGHQNNDSEIDNDTGSGESNIDNSSNEHSVPLKTSPKPKRRGSRAASNPPPVVLLTSAGPNEDGSINETDESEDVQPRLSEAVLHARDEPSFTPQPLRQFDALSQTDSLRVQRGSRIVSMAMRDVDGSRSDSSSDGHSGDADLAELRPLPVTSTTHVSHVSAVTLPDSIDVCVRNLDSGEVISLKDAKFRINPKTGFVEPQRPGFWKKQYRKWKWR